MIGHESGLDLAENYRRFGQEAHGRSEVYARWARAVASDPGVLGFLRGLPPEKRQPNLLFAAARWLDPDLASRPGYDAGYDTLRAIVLDRRDELASVMLQRRTQTNEPARCATLLPALARLPQPLALLEVGASAGLTLLPDRYGYEYDGRTIPAPETPGVPDTPEAPGAVPAPEAVAPTLACHPYGPVPVPAQQPRVVWRAGLDLHPLDVTDADDVAWLRCLVWPNQPERSRRLDATVAIARHDPPSITRGDLVDDLGTLADQAPADATLVVFHSAVLAYVSAGRRQAFADLMQTMVRNRSAVWLSNEGPGVLATLNNPPEVPAAPPEASPFVLVRDGRAALAFTQSHGSWIQWI